MADAPERIWAFEDYPGSGAVPRGGMWCDEQSECPEGTPAYIRADLAEALASFARHFAEALDVECDFMTPPAPIEDGFEARRLARAALRSTEASHD